MRKLSMWKAALLLLAAPCLAPRASADELSPPYAGFIWHYPFVQVGDSQIAASGANVMMARGAWGSLEPAEGQFNFTSLRQQLQVARQQGFKIVLLLEFNPFCAPDWLKTKCRTAGEMTANYDGSVGTMPRVGSPVFTAAQRAFLAELKNFLTNEDPQHTVTHYMPGIEWWFPFQEEYAATDVQGFRDWVAAHYETVAALNAAWGTSYANLSDVQIPRFDFGSTPFMQQRVGMTTVTMQFSPPVGGTPAPTCPLAAVNDWGDYWHQRAAEFVDSMASLVKEVDTSRPCASFGTYAWAQAAEWDYVDMSRMRLDWMAHGAVAQDILGMQLAIGGGDTYRQTFGLDSARKYGKPMWNMDLVDFVDGIWIGYAAHEKATHAAIQHGANALFYCCWNGAADFNFHPDWPMDRLNKMVSDGRQALELTHGMQLDVQGAIVNTIGSIAPGDPAAGRNNVFSMIGWYKLLERRPGTVDVATLTEVEKGWANLSGYRWLLVPDCPYLSTAALDALTSYSQHGGLLIRGGRFGTYDEDGRPRTLAAPPGIGLSDFGQQYAGTNLVRENHAGGTPPEMLWRAETAQTSQTRATALLQLGDALVQAGITESIDVCNGQLDIRSALFKRDGSYLVYLVNMEPQPVEGVKLRVNLNGVALSSVHLDLDLAPEGSLHLAADRTLTLPAFRTSALIKLGPTSATQMTSFAME